MIRRLRSFVAAAATCAIVGCLDSPSDDAAADGGTEVGRPDGRVDAPLFEPSDAGVDAGAGDTGALDGGAWGPDVSSRYRPGADDRAVCLRLTPETELEFGVRSVGSQIARDVVVANCGTRSLRFVRASVDSPAEGGPFSVEEQPVRGDELVPGAAWRIRVAYEARFFETEPPEACEPGEACPERHEAELQVEVEERDEAVVLPLRGGVTELPCREIAAGMWLAGDDAPQVGPLEVPPLTTVRLGASGVGVPGEPDPSWSFRWTMRERPEGAVAVEPAAPDAVATSVSVLMAGRYVIALSAVDAAGVNACEDRELVVDAIPEVGFYVDLTWETPGDADWRNVGAGAGSDMDLHVLHPNGSWDMQPWDVHWKNTRPTWTTESAGNPELRIEDTDGWGPEVVTLERPEITARDEDVCLKVGVFYFSDHDFGPATPTVRVWLGGREAMTVRGPRMADRAFWEALEVCLPAGAGRFVDELYPSGVP